MQDGRRLLVVEDDESVRKVVSSYLVAEGYEVDETGNGDIALEMIASNAYDLLVLDLMLPGADGLDIARRVSVQDPDVLVLMLTARTDESDQLIGFGVGADDYLTKPFSPKVLVARVKALLRRSEGSPGTQSGTGASVVAHQNVNVGRISMDMRSREVRVDSRPVEFTVAEFDLLAKLAEHPGWVYTREQLMTEAWDYDIAGSSRTVDMHIANIRRKLGEDPERPAQLVTVRGVGYKLIEPAPSGDGVQRD